MSLVEGRMEDLVALHCLFLLGTDWILGQNGNKGQGPMAADSIPKSGHEGCSGGLRKPSGGGYGAEEMGIPYFKARGRYGLELVGEVA